MIPLRDDVPATRVPVVTRTLVLLCTVVFVLQLGDPRGDLVVRYGMVPSRVFGADAPTGLLRLFTPAAAPPAAVPDWLTLLTCTFLHGGWMHFVGNMLFLWIFGDNVEDRFGRVRYLLFYVGCGVAASAAHLLTARDSPVPTIGASGAIAGVMGAYLFLYPHARVQMLIVFGFLIDLVVLPAPFFLGYWFLLQLLGGFVDGGTGGGVAWWAHIGGFVAGALVALLLKHAGWLSPAPQQVVLQRRRLGSRPRPGW
jgi:membrane associated rhomboid family serine protease